ncbi:hypothetical protein HK405_010444, partial [Cladochytrium tenue]
SPAMPRRLVVGGTHQPPPRRKSTRNHRTAAAAAAAAATAASGVAASPAVAFTPSVVAPSVSPLVVPASLALPLAPTSATTYAPFFSAAAALRYTAVPAVLNPNAAATAAPTDADVAELDVFSEFRSKIAQLERELAQLRPLTGSAAAAATDAAAAAAAAAKPAAPSLPASRAVSRRTSAVRQSVTVTAPSPQAQPQQQALFDEQQLLLVDQGGGRQDLPALLGGDAAVALLSAISSAAPDTPADHLAISVQPVPVSPILLNRPVVGATFPVPASSTHDSAVPEAGLLPQARLARSQRNPHVLDPPTARAGLRNISNGVPAVQALSLLTAYTGSDNGHLGATTTDTARNLTEQIPSTQAPAPRGLPISAVPLTISAGASMASGFSFSNASSLALPATSQAVGGGGGGVGSTSHGRVALAQPSDKLFSESEKLGGSSSVDLGLWRSIAKRRILRNSLILSNSSLPQDSRRSSDTTDFRKVRAAKPAVDRLRLRKAATAHTSNSSSLVSRSASHIITADDDDTNMFDGTAWVSASDYSLPSPEPRTHSAYNNQKLLQTSEPASATVTANVQPHRRPSRISFVRAASGLNTTNVIRSSSYVNDDLGRDLHDRDLDDLDDFIRSADPEAVIGGGGGVDGGWPRGKDYYDDVDDDDDDDELDFDDDDRFDDDDSGALNSAANDAAATEKAAPSNQPSGSAAAATAPPPPPPPRRVLPHRLARALRRFFARPDNAVKGSMLSIP